MNLYRKDIDVPFVNETVSGVYPYQYSSTDMAGWDNISSVDGICNNDLYGEYAADYVRATKEMALLFDGKSGSTETEKWNNCTLDEKKCLAKRMIVNSQSLRLEVYSSDDDSYNFNIHAQKSIDCRQLRIDTAKINMGYKLSVDDRVDLFTSIQSMINTFINVNDSSLTTWMHSDFLNKSYHTSELEDIYTEIVENGIY